ncbi:MAG: SpoIIE family protein phosphatase, partial [Actinomycetes bacterium]
IALAPYAEGVSKSQIELADLDRLLASVEPEMSSQVARVRAARDAWLTTSARPTIAAVRGGKSATAQEIVTSSASHQSYAILQAEASALLDDIDDSRQAALAKLSDFSIQLAVALVSTSAVLTVGLIGAVLLIRWWVLQPLDRLRVQLREVARDGAHEDPIVPSGPPELEAAGQDAEEMRRQLVAEIDEARMAREGLEQEGPVVTAIRTELARPQTANVAGVEIFGDLQPAEGVLAGDWWDVLALPDGRVALVLTDVSGHGPAAGISGLRTKVLLTNLLTEGVLVPDALARAADLFSDTPGRFASCVVVIVDAQARTVQWANAGHLNPLIVSPRSAPRQLELTGPLLSALGGVWTTQTCGLSPDDVLLMWTDGLSESRDLAGQELAETDLTAVLQQAVAASGSAPRELVPSVLADARSRAVDWRRDDVTLVAARLAGQN